MKICMHCYISGQVQGVWYRGSTRDKALSLGITGYARNLPDGRVEVLACGEEESLATLAKWLWQGPPAAQVSDVQCQRVSHQQVADFVVC